MNEQKSILILINDKAILSLSESNTALLGSYDFQFTCHTPAKANAKAMSSDIAFQLGPVPI